MKKRIEYSYDGNGIFCGEKVNQLTGRDVDFFLLPFCITEKPNAPKGKVAVINEDKSSWIYKEDKSGEWYHKETKALLFLAKKDYQTDISEYTRAIPEGDFRILEYNSKKDCWEKSTEKEKELVKENNRNEILLKLTEIDRKSIRAYRGYIISKNNADLEKIKEYENEAEKLRAELKELEK